MCYNTPNYILGNVWRQYSETWQLYIRLITYIDPILTAHVRVKILDIKMCRLAKQSLETLTLSDQYTFS